MDVAGTGCCGPGGHIKTGQQEASADPQPAAIQTLRQTEGSTSLW
jgi:hypothetical protein